MNEAIRARDRVALQRLLDEGDGRTLPLRDALVPQYAPRDNIDPEIVRLLLAYGADPNAPGGQPPLQIAARFIHLPGALDAFRALLEYGADPNQTSRHGSTALHQLATDRSPVAAPAVRLLLDHQANPNVIDARSGTPLHYAVDATVVTLLVEHGADLGARDDNYLTPLHRQASEMRLENVRTLLEHGADVNAENRNGLTVLDGVWSKVDGGPMVDLLRSRQGKRQIEIAWAQRGGKPTIAEGSIGSVSIRYPREVKCRLGCDWDTVLENGGAQPTELKGEQHLLDRRGHRWIYERGGGYFSRSLAAYQSKTSRDSILPSEEFNGGTVVRSWSDGTGGTFVQEIRVFW